MRLKEATKMLKKVFLIAILIILSSCIISKKIERKYQGSTREVIIKEMGEPKRIIKLDGGNELFIYEKEKYIRETEIGIGKPTLDPRISPAFTRIETFRFTIDPNGIIISTSYKKEYK